MFNSTFGSGSQELRDIKIKLSKKEQELKALKETLTSLEEKLTRRDQDYDALQKERDTLRLKNELMAEKLEQNGISIDFSEVEALSNKT